MKKLFLFAAIALSVVACKQNPNDMKQQQVLDNILTRVSVRHFTAQKPTDQQINLLLQAAMAAPSAVNRQPWAFIVVDDPELLRQIGEALPNSRVQNGAQVAIVPCGDLTKTMDGEAREFWIHDTSAATQNILLAAHAMGLGAVWTAVQPGADRIAATRAILNIPEHLIPLCIIPVGYPDEQPEVKQKYTEDNIFYNRFE